MQQHWTIKEFEIARARDVALKARADVEIPGNVVRLVNDRRKAAFVEAVAKGVPELTEYRDRQARAEPMQVQLDRARVEVQGVAVEVAKAKLDLSGVALAKRLVELDGRRKEAEAEIVAMEAGLALYRSDLEAAKQAASAALEKVADAIAMETFLAAKEEYRQELDRFAQVLGEHAARLYPMRECARPPQPGVCASLAAQAIAGTLTATAAPATAAEPAAPKSIVSDAAGASAPVATA